MIVLLDTSTPLCKVLFVDNGSQMSFEWQADRDLARGLLQFLTTLLNDNDLTWQDITALGAFKGPGSFTGLRIGLTVINTLADSLQVPIVGATGDAWTQTVLDRLNQGENDQIVLPEYGADARITQPRK